MQKFLVFTGLGLELGALVFLALLIGRTLDESYHTNGLIFLGLTLIFMAAWFTQIIWMVRRLQKDSVENPNPSGSSSSSKDS